MRSGGATYMGVVLLSLLASAVVTQAPPAAPHAAGPGITSLAR